MAGLTLIGDVNPTGVGATHAPAAHASTAVDDLVVIVYAFKRATQTLSTPAGWTATAQTAVGTGAAGEGTGQIKLGAFWQILDSAYSAPTLSPGGTTPLIISGAITWRPDTGWTVEVSTTTGSDTSSDTSFSVTGGSTLPFIADDWIITTVAVTNNTVDAPSFDAIEGTAPGGASGATFDTLDSRWNSQSSTGDNMRTGTYTAICLSGPATTGPSVAATLNVAMTGGGMFTRLHPVHMPWHILGIDGTSAGNHFKLQAAPDGGGAIFEKTQAEIAAGYYEDPYFIAVGGSDKEWCQFRVRLDSQTTAGSDYPRSELREMATDGTTNQAFNTASNTHRLRGTFRVTHLPPVKPSVVFAQVHDGSNDLVQLRTDKNATTGLIEVKCSINGSSSGQPVLHTNYVVGDIYEYMIEIIAGTTKIYFGDMLHPVITTTAVSTTTAYFKTGCYAQSNETIDSASEYMSVDIKNLRAWHTGMGGSDGTTPSALSTPLFPATRRFRPLLVR